MHDRSGLGIIEVRAHGEEPALIGTRFVLWMIPLALAVTVWCVVVVVRKTRNDDGPILRRYGLLVVAVIFIVLGSFAATVTRRRRRPCCAVRRLSGRRSGPAA